MSRRREPTLREAMKTIDKLLHETRATRREVKVLQHIVSKGAEAVRPWMRLPRPRRRQVEATIAYLKAHPDRSEHSYSRVAELTFAPAAGNFASDRSLASYLYKTDPDIYL